MQRVIFWGSEHLTQLRKYVDADIYVDDSTYIGEAGLTFTTDDLLVCCGDAIVKQFEQRKILPKNRVVSTLRKNVYTFQGAKLLLMYPSEIYRTDYKSKISTLCDLKDIKRYKECGFLCEPFENYKWVDNFDELFKDMYKGEPLIVAFDTETIKSLFNKSASILCVSFAWMTSENELCARAVYTHGKNLNDYAIQQLRTLLQTDQVKARFANGKYDLAWIRQLWGIECRNFNVDTLLAGNLLDENRSNSLSTHARVYTSYSNYDLEFNAKYDKNAMDKVPLDELLKYACMDAVACYLSSLKIVEELKALHPNIATLAKSDYHLFPYWRNVKNTPLQLYIKLIHPISTVFTKIESEGICVDVEYQHELSLQLQNEIEEASLKGLEFIPDTIKNNYLDNLSLTRASLLADFLYSSKELGGLGLPVTEFTPTGKMSTAMNTLMDVIEQAPEHVKPFAKLVKTYSKLSKTKSTYVDGFMKHLCDDNRFHSTYFLHKGSDDFGDGGTVTSRCSNVRPSFHTLPKSTPDAPRLRKAYIAPPDHYIVEFDMEQLELRLSAYFSRDATMLQAYRNKVDLHTLMGSRIGRITLEEMLKLPKEQFEALRQTGKQGNLGFLYGSGPKTFKRQTKIQHDTVITFEEAKFMYETFHSTFPGLRAFEWQLIKFAKHYKMVINPFGYISRLPFINHDDVKIARKMEQKVVNRVIQSTGSNILMLALLVVSEQLPELKLFATIHDSGLGYLKISKLEETLLKLKQLVENLPLREMFRFDLYDHISLPCAIKYGKNLGELQLWEG